MSKNIWTLWLEFFEWSQDVNPVGADEEGRVTHCPENAWGEANGSCKKQQTGANQTGPGGAAAKEHEQQHRVGPIVQESDFPTV